MVFSKLLINFIICRSFFSKKQAEYFIANQAQMLSHNEGKALSPEQLQQKISSILAANPDMAEAVSVSFVCFFFTKISPL